MSKIKLESGVVGPAPRNTAPIILDRRRSIAASETDKLVADAQRELFGWVPLKYYQMVFPTETLPAIKARIKRGIWSLGVHVKKVDGMGYWVNLQAVKKKIES